MVKMAKGLGIVAAVAFVCLVAMMFIDGHTYEALGVLVFVSAVAALATAAIASDL